MHVLGIESSCDETGVALVEADGAAVPRLLAHALHSQVDMHQAYGGVVPELASRDHIRRVLPLAQQVLAEAGRELSAVDVVAYTRGPGLAGALLVGAGVACALGAALGKPVLGVHHLEGHLLSPFLSADPPQFPFVALLVSGVSLMLTPLIGVLLPMPRVSRADVEAVELRNQPEVVLPITARSGPIVIEIDYHVDPQRARQFYEVMLKVQGIRLRNGAFDWSLSRDIATPDLWTERYHCPTWGDYLRQRSRFTQGDRELQLQADGFHAPGPGSRVRRRLERPFVAAVSPDSPAAAAGLMRDDVVLSIDGRDSLERPLFPGLAPGRAYTVRVKRGNELMEPDHPPSTLE